MCLARKAEAEAHRVSQLAKIEEDRIQAERAIAAAELAGEEVRRCVSTMHLGGASFRSVVSLCVGKRGGRCVHWRLDRFGGFLSFRVRTHHYLTPLSPTPSFHQREKAIREAEEERRARIQALEQANEMEEAKKRAEHEAEQMRLQRAISVANRKEMLERMNREAEEKAKRVEELTAMLDEAKHAAKDAEIRALKAESAVSLEEERAKEKKKAEKSLIEAAVRKGGGGGGEGAGASGGPGRAAARVFLSPLFRKF